jgi:PAS domain-containing protein
LETEHRATEAKLAWLATFPEQNPNLVIETDVTGRVTYLNPVAQTQFPELWTEGFAHPLLKDLRPLVAAFESGNHPYVAREIDSGDAVYEQKICYTRQGDLVRVRVYASDITRRSGRRRGYSNWRSKSCSPRRRNGTVCHGNSTTRRDKR